MKLIPHNPERNGHHWVRMHVAPQLDEESRRLVVCWKDGAWLGVNIDDAIYEYICPCLTPEEIDHLSATARASAFREATAWHDERISRPHHDEHREASEHFKEFARREQAMIEGWT